MNTKAIFKKLVCPKCNAWTPDETGKATARCKKCDVDMYLSLKWCVRISIRGKVTVKTVSTRKQEAEDYYHAAKDAIRKDVLLPGEETNITWDDAKTNFENWIKAGTLAKNTQEFYLNGLKHLNTFFTEDLQNITVRRVEAYRDSRIAAGSAPKSVAEEIKMLKRMFSLECRWNSARLAPDLHAANADLEKVEMPRYHNSRSRYLTEDEVQLLLNKCNVPHLKLAISIALSTGLRHSNIMSLEWQQIDLVNRTITFKSKDMKSKRVFVSPLMEHLCTYFYTYRQEQKPISPFVFPRKDPSTPMTDMQYSWEKLIKDCNIDLKKKKLPDFQRFASIPYAIHLQAIS